MGAHAIDTRVTAVVTASLFNLEGKTALVTGASSGFGRRFASVLARACRSDSFTVIDRLWLERLTEINELVQVSVAGAVRDPPMQLRRHGRLRRPHFEGGHGRACASSTNNGRLTSLEQVGSIPATQMASGNDLDVYGKYSNGAAPMRLRAE
jgi:hypothetical protein